MEEDPLSLLEMLPLEIVRLVHDEACKDGLAALPFSMLNTFANLHFPFDKFAKDPHSILNRCAELGYIGYCRWYSSAFAKDRLRGTTSLRLLCFSFSFTLPSLFLFSPSPFPSVSIFLPVFLFGVGPFMHWDPVGRFQSGFFIQPYDSSYLIVVRILYIYTPLIT